jgi:hypothetical protein
VVGPDCHESSAFAGGDGGEGGFELLADVDALRRAPLVFDVLCDKDVGTAFDPLAIDDSPGSVGSHRGATEFDDFRARSVDWRNRGDFGVGDPRKDEQGGD